uniref:Uncharacterized protein n=1 Tax=Anopheles coluzzii TaxID=1518534 RepID=A0A8W7PXS7_ANOCL
MAWAAVKVKNFASISSPMRSLTVTTKSAYRGTGQDFGRIFIALQQGLNLIARFAILHHLGNAVGGRHRRLTAANQLRPVMMGLTIPGIVANVFEMPISTPALFGDRSRWFTANPDHANAPNPTAMVMQVIVGPGSRMNAPTIMNTVWARKAPQLK